MLLMFTITLMNNTIRTLVWMATILLLIIALYSMAGRLLVAKVNDYQTDIENTLSQAMNTQVRVGTIKGGWSGISPIITLNDIVISANDPSVKPLSTSINIDSIRLQPDFVGMIINRTVTFSDISVDGLTTYFEQLEDRRWIIRGLKADKPPPTLPQLFEFLLNNRKFAFLNPYVEFKPYQQEPYILDDVEIQLERRANGMRAVGKIKFPYQRSKTKIDKNIAPYINWIVNGVGDPKQFDQFSFKAYGRVDPVSLNNYLPNAKVEDKFKITSLSLGNETWMEVISGEVKQIKSLLSIPKLEMARRDDVVNNEWKTLPALSKLNAEIKVDHVIGSTMWDAWVDNLDFYFGSQHWQPKQMRLKVNRGEHTDIYLEHDGLNIATAINSVIESSLIKPQTQKGLSELSPKGIMKDIVFRMHIPKNDDNQTEKKPNYQLDATIQQASVLARGGSPATSGLDGKLRLVPGGGFFDVDSDNLTLHFSNLFSNAWSFQQAKGRLYFKANPIDGLSIKTDQLRLFHPASELRVALNLALPPDPTLHQMNLAVSLLNIDLAVKNDFLPNTLDKNLYDYLDRAMEKGLLTDGAFLFHGELAKNAPDIAKTLEMYINLDRANLDYSPEPPNPNPVWPKLTDANSYFMIDQDGIFGAIEQAKVYKTNLNQLDIALPFVNGKARELRLKGNAKGTLSDSLRFLQNTPLAKATNNAIKDWSSSVGTTAIDVDLVIPFDKTLTGRTAIDVDVQNADLTISSLKLIANNINGDLNLSNQGINADKMTMDLFAEPVDVSINSAVNKTEGKQVSTTQIRVEGAVKGKALYDWSDQPLLSLLDGKTNYVATLDLNSEKDMTDESVQAKRFLTVKSDLQGLAIDLPGALKKEKQQTNEFNLLLNIGDISSRLAINYLDDVKALLLLEQSVVKKGEITINSGNPSLPLQNGLNVKANLAQVDLEEWQLFIKKLQSRSQSTNSSNIINRIAVNTDQLDAFGQSLNQVESIITRLTDAYLISVKSPMINGNITLADDTNTPIAIDLDYLRLADNTNDKTTDMDSFSKPDPMEKVNPQTLPPMNVSAREITIGSENLGDWSFEFRPNALGAKVRSIRANFKSLVLSDLTDQYGATLDWYYLDGLHSTRLEGTLSGLNMANVLEELGNAGSIESTRFSANHSFEWDGSPALFDIMRLRGGINLNIERGQFVEIKSAANALQVIGVFDFNALTRRLRLDFSDIAPGGFNFDKINGDFFLDEGILINRSLTIDNPSSTFQMVGSVDLLGQQVDQELIVTLPVSRNLPWYALLGGPQLAAGVFVAGQIFRNQIEQFSSARYSVIGPFDNLNVEFVKIFNNEFEQSPFVEGALENQ